MIVLGISISILLGIAFLLVLSNKLKLTEIVGLAFPVGIGMQTMLMVLLDTCSIPLNAKTMLGSSFFILTGLIVWLWFKRSKIQEWKQNAFKFNFSEINLLWVIFFAAIVYMEYMNFAKCIYFPTADRDSLAGFDLLGKVFAAEENMKNISLYNSPNFYAFARKAGSYISYTPFVQCSYAYIYMLGAATSKIVNALHFLSFIIAFYGVLTRFVVPTLAIIATFFAFITPEMIAFSSLSATNVLHAYYASLGILFFVAWFYKKEQSLLWISATLLMLNIWTRNEGIVFIGACCCVLLWHAIKQKKYKTFILFSLLCITPFVLWNIYLKVFNLESVQVFIFKPFWDGEKASIINTEVWNLLTNIQYYGVSFVLFLIMIIVNIKNIFKGDQVVILVLFFLSLIFYTILIYQINYIWDAIENVLSYSYKRYLFCFIPIVWFYIAANRNMRWLFDKILGIKTLEK